MYYFVTMMLLIKNHGTLCQGQRSITNNKFCTMGEEKKESNKLYCHGLTWFFASYFDWSDNNRRDVGLFLVQRYKIKSLANKSFLKKKNCLIIKW
jgi:hypothetical protein